MTDCYPVHNNFDKCVCNFCLDKRIEKIEIKFVELDKYLNTSIHNIYTVNNYLRKTFESIMDEISLLKNNYKLQ